MNFKLTEYDAPYRPVTWRAIAVQESGMTMLGL
jgi:hypothetical protein